MFQLKTPAEKTEGNRNQRWKTGINGELFSGHPGVKNTQSSQYSQNSQYSQFPSRSLASVLIPPALPGKTEGNRNQRWKTGINGVPFPGHPGVSTVLNRFCPFSLRSPQPILSECAHPFGSAGNAFQPEFWEYWEY